MDTIKNLIGPAMTAMLAPSTTPPTTLIAAKVDWGGFESRDKASAEMLAASQAFADAVENRTQPRWLVLLGKSGIGKSHLARQLYRWFWRHGCWFKDSTGACHEMTSRFVRWRQTASELRSGGWGEVQDIIERDFVVIDDIGAEHQGGTGAVKSALERIMDERLGKWTIVTSNLSLQLIAEEIDTRVASRMRREGNVIVNAKETSDYNAPKKQ